MSSQFSFERLCITSLKGFVFDERQIIMPYYPDNYDELVFKLLTKCDTNLLLLESHKGKLKNFSLEVIPLDPPDECNRGSNFWSGVKASKTDSCLDIIEKAWDVLEEECDGLLTLGILGLNSMPDNGCREKYTLAQFVDHVVSSIESYYMFHKPRDNFTPKQIKDNVTPIQEDSRSYKNGFGIVVIWNYTASKNKSANPLKMSPSILNQTRSPQKSSVPSFSISPKPNNSENNNSLLLSPLKDQEEMECTRERSVQVQKRTLNEGNVAVPAKKARGRPSRRVVVNEEEEESDHIDEEVSFRTSRALNRTNTQMTNQVNSEVEVENNSTKENNSTVLNSSLPQEKITFGFEQKTAKRGTKSMGRKSLVPDWQEDQKMEILAVFDNLNPKITETTQIALTCKYASIQFDRELSSKVLYLWVQKKGRQINRSITNFDLDESQVKKTAVEFYKTLNSDMTESGRVAFVIKYFKAQFDFIISSKDLLMWISDKKNSKTTKGKRRC